MSNAGYDDVRAKIASSLNARFGTNYEGGGVVMTVGAAGGLNVVLKSLLDDGDEVIVVSPYFGEYRCYAANFGGKLVEVPALADFMPDCAAIEAAVGERTKAVIVNTPNNPTGAVYGADVLKELAQALGLRRSGTALCRRVLPQHADLLFVQQVAVARRRAHRLHRDSPRRGRI